MGRSQVVQKLYGHVRDLGLDLLGNYRRVLSQADASILFIFLSLDVYPVFNEESRLDKSGLLSSRS